jgi:hypothetical protein
MVGVDLLTNVASALSQTFAKKIANQWNRVTVLASKLPSEGAAQGNAKNVAWDVGFTSAVAASYAEGDDVGSGEMSVDTFVPATLSWGHYRTAFQVSETEFDAAAASIGSADALISLFDARIMSSVGVLAAAVNSDLWIGDGTDGSGNPTIVGLHGGALETTGTYATILRSSYGEWAGNVLSNGSVARPLTVSLMEQMDAQIFARSSLKPNLIVCDPQTFRKYKGLFESLRRFEGVSVSQYDTSTSELFFQGIPIHRDKDAPSGTMTFINTDELAKVYLPASPMSSEDVWKVAQREGEGDSGDFVTPTGLPFKIVPLAKTGDSLKFMIKVVLNLKVRRPNCMGYISDIDVS